MVIGPWRLLEPLGEGGMGIVWKAEHIETGQLAALKTVRSSDAEQRAGIRREIRALERLAHPQLARVVDHHTTGDAPYLALQLITGQTLRQHWGAPGAVSPGLPTWSPTDALPLTEPTAPRVLPDPIEGITLLRRLCAPLAYLHGEGLVHGDLKPSNVLLASGWPVLVDFGVARLLGAREGLAETRPRGTWAYMAPEQVAGGVVDGRADLYALGCLLYELFAGLPPFGFDSSALDGHLRRRAPRIEDVPPGVQLLLDTLLHKDPAERPPSAVHVASSLVGLGAADESLPGPPPRPWLHQTRLIGRQTEIELLDARLQRALDGEASRWVLSGPTGSGKTRFAQEAAARARSQGWRVLAGSARPPGAAEVARPALDTLCEPLGQLLQSAARGGWAKELPEEAVRAVQRAMPGADQPGPALPADLVRTQLLRAVTQVLAAASAREPVLLLIDDLQWADALTMRWWAEQPLHGRVLAVGCALQSQVPLELGELHRLGSLGEIEGLVDGMLGGHAPEELASHVAARAVGSPLIAAELLRYAATIGALVQEPGGWRWDRSPLPQARELIEIRLGQVGQRPLLDALAVLGRDAPLELVTRATDLPEEQALDGISALLRAQILHEPELGRVGFVHSQVQQAVLDAMGPEVRRSAHRRSASLLDGADLAVRAGHHELGAEPDKAADLYLRAGEEAAERMDLAAARSYFEASTRLATDAHQRALALLGLAEKVLAPEGRRDEVQELCRPLFASDLPARTRARAGIAAAIPEVLPVAASLDPTTQARAHASLSAMAHRRGQFTAAIDHSQRSLALIDEHRLPGRGRALARRGLTRRELGQHEGAAEDFLAALAIHRAEGARYAEAQVMNSLAGLRLYQGDPEEAARLLFEVRQIASELGADAFVGYSSFDLAVARQQQGRYADALIELNRATAVFSEAGDALLAKLCATQRAEILYESGALLQARQVLSDANLDGDERNIEIAVVKLKIAEAGRPPESQAAELETALETARSTGSPHNLGELLWLLARATLALGHRAEALRLLDEAADVLESYLRPLAIVDLERAQLGDVEAARRALAAFERLGDHPRAQRARDLIG